MNSLADWLSCPDCGPSSNLRLETWAYGFQVECEGCNDVFYYEL